MTGGASPLACTHISHHTRALCRAVRDTDDAPRGRHPAPHPLHRWGNFAPHRTGDPSGNSEFLTPNLEALAASGMLLDRHYGHKVRVVSRSR